jgi:hypothetical protein
VTKICRNQAIPEKEVRGTHIFPLIRQICRDLEDTDKVIVTKKVRKEDKDHGKQKEENKN